MKLTNMIVVVILVVLCVFGWMTLVSGNVSQGAERENTIQQAEDCMERGLYQRAIEYYQDALDGQADEDLYLNIANAYSKRYKEAPEDTFDDYLKFVKNALNALPGNRTLVDHLVPLCLNGEGGEADYKTLYTYLKKAVANGCDDEDTLALCARARYDYSLRGNTFQSITDTGTKKYSVRTDRGWNVYDMSGGYQLTSNWNYVGPLSDDGVTVITGEDSRIFDTANSMVLGIFQTPVSVAGVYAEGLIPAQISGKYGYYNDYADYQFGSYDYAGTFQDGLAAVEENGKWMLVNTKGEVERDGLEQIVGDLAGRYQVQDAILVKEAGTYVVYDTKWKRRADLACDEVDILSTDGVIATRTGSRWGFVDMDGNTVIEPIYAAARSFSNGLAAVQNSEGLWGFVDKTGRLVIDYTFADTGYMSAAGVCPVRVDAPPEEPAYDDQAGEQIEVPEEWVLLVLTNGITKD